MLKVENLSISFLANKKKVSIVEKLSFELHQNEVLAIVGESGCGKSVTCLALGRLLNPDQTYVSGRVIYNGVDLLSLSEHDMQRYRGHKIAYIFQEPTLCLNPVMRIGEQIQEVLELHHLSSDHPRQKVLDLLEKVGIADPRTRINCYPHELSGGMQQRIVIAMALAGEPDVLIADEPTTALDVTVQAQILQLLKVLQKQHQMSIVLVTHNLGLVGELADRIMVMYAGEMVEIATKNELILNPCHPYTQALLKAVPQLDFSQTTPLVPIRGRVPSPTHYPSFCRFAERCYFCMPKCKFSPIELHSISATHELRCVK